MKTLILLGASGSIGKQTLEVIDKYPNRFKLNALSVGRRDDNLEDLILKYELKAVGLMSEERIEELKIKFPKIKFYNANTELSNLIDENICDVLVNAVVGIAGLKPTVSAINNKMDVALANKETLVTGGDLIMNLIQENNVNLYPIDSEHSAIWQALHGNDKKDLHSITLTASGGSFRDLSREELEFVTKEQALDHPNWSMGEKITIDSATMMNKGLEIIEAHYLFDIDYDNINVLINHQSVIHSFVEFNDYSILAQMGSANMNVPIQFALTYPNHLALNNNERLNLAKIKNLSFVDVDFKRYPLVKLAYDMGRLKGNKPIIMNAANEVAVQLFLDEKISFLDIETIVINISMYSKYEEITSFDEIYIVNDNTKTYVLDNYEEIIKMVKIW